MNYRLRQVNYYKDAPNKTQSSIFYWNEYEDLLLDIRRCILQQKNIRRVEIWLDRAQEGAKGDKVWHEDTVLLHHYEIPNPKKIAEELLKVQPIDASTVGPALRAMMDLPSEETE